jgi:hypothetical protein
MLTVLLLTLLVNLYRNYKLNINIFGGFIIFQESSSIIISSCYKYDVKSNYLFTLSSHLTESY